MRVYPFNSRMQLGPTLPDFDQAAVKREPMLFSCSYNYAAQVGGPLTHAFLCALPDEWKGCIIDSRVHMLMPGWYPAIPGYHHDDVPRDRADGQPEYDFPRYSARHCMALVNGEICPTEFALGASTFEEVPLGKKIYDQWHREVVEKLAAGELASVKAPSNQLVFFDRDTWHQGTAAVKNGWRWFIRATIDTDRKFLNETRQQVQVYLAMPTEGW